MNTIGESPQMSERQSTLRVHSLFSFRSILLQSGVQRKRVGLSSEPLWIDRYLVLNQDYLLYYKRKPLVTNCPLLKVSVNDILKAVALGGNQFEICLK
jgi:hypothetical protein